MTQKKNSLFHSNRPIGELNGHWAALLKIILVAVPIMIPIFLTWAIWVTAAVFEGKYHLQASECASVVNADFHKEIKLRWKDTSQRLDALHAKHATYDRNNSDEHADITIALQSIKTKLDTIN